MNIRELARGAGITMAFLLLAGVSTAAAQGLGGVVRGAIPPIPGRPSLPSGLPVGGLNPGIGGRPDLGPGIERPNGLSGAGLNPGSGVRQEITSAGTERPNVLSGAALNPG